MKERTSLLRSADKAIRAINFILDQIGAQTPGTIFAIRTFIRAACRKYQITRQILFAEWAVVKEMLR